MSDLAPPRLLHSLDRDELAAAAADNHWPKWSTMCQLRRLGNPVLNAICVNPASVAALPAAILTLTEATHATRLMVRSDGGIETGAYYRGGNSYPVDQVEPHAAELLAAGRAVILLEPTNRFTNRLSVLLRMDRPVPGKPGTFTVEALGPGYDVGDLTRGGILPQITVSIEDVTWHRYEEPWWADLRVVRNLDQAAEQHRRLARLQRLAGNILSSNGQPAPADATNAALVAERWLRDQGHVDLWSDTDPTLRVVRAVAGWFDAAFLIAAAHPARGWRCLATALSDLGAGRVVYWDIVDAAHKYGMATHMYGTGQPVGLRRTL
jgi:hypothetical protein